MNAVYKSQLDTGCDPTGKLVILNRLLRYCRLVGLQGLFYDLFRNQRIIDFGCGTFNPLTIATILYANGCEEVICFEPSSIDKVASRNLRALIQAIRQDEDCFNFSGVKREVFSERLSLIQPNCLDDLTGVSRELEYNYKICDGFYLTNNLSSLSARSPTLLFSNSVLEHILDLNSSLRVLADFYSRSCIQFHTVDYADHRFYKLSPEEQQNHPERLFQFLEEGDDPLRGNDVYGITSLRRPSELESIFSSYNLRYSVLETQYAPIGIIQKIRLSEKFRSFHFDDLNVWVRGYLVRAG